MKDQLFYYLLFAFSISFSSGDITVEIGTDPTVLSIKLNDTLIFYHSASSPLISLGVGEAEFTNIEGNFVIDDQILYIDGLPIFDIVSELDDSAEISFTADGEDRQATLIINETVSENGIPVFQYDITTVFNTVSYNRLFLKLFGEEEEKLYGAGEQYTYFNLKGHKFPIWTSEQGIGRNNITNISDSGVVGSYYTTYWPQASYISNRLYAHFIKEYEYLELNFEKTDEILVYIHSTWISGNILVSVDVKELVPMIAQFIGLPPPLPDWILKGSIIALENGTNEVTIHYNQIKDAGVDVSALWIQDWSGKLETEVGYRVHWNWELDESLYPNFATTIADLQNDNVNVMLYCNPHLVLNSSMYIEAEQLGYFLNNSGRETYLQDFGGFSAGTIDLYSTEARNWYADKLNLNMVGLGIMGWMGDLGEFINLDMVSSESRTQEELHNLFPVLWAETNQQIAESSLSSDVVYFMRSGGLGSSGYQMLAWAGDQNVDFSIDDGLASTIVAALSLSVSGMGYTHFDIGGYTTIPPSLTRTKELLIRSAEYAAFTPVMRTHLGNMPGENVQIYDSPDILSEFARLTNIHSRLFDYTRFVVDEFADEGIPTLRPMFYHYGGDSHTWNLMHQYMYGSDLIVGPVIHQGQTEVTVYIPSGDNAVWIPLWAIGGEDLIGPRNVSILTPFGFPAVLYRQDSIFAQLFIDIGTEFGVTPP